MTEQQLDRIGELELAQRQHAARLERLEQVIGDELVTIELCDLRAYLDAHGLRLRSVSWPRGAGALVGDVQWNAGAGALAAR